MKFLGEI
jgi:hypothetical protein